MYDKRCGSCGYHLTSYYKTGYLGCPDCYKNFRNEIKTTLRDFQGGTFHVGKKPKFSLQDKELYDDYNRYIKEKEKACLEKRFSDISKLNRLIAELEEELKRRGII